MSILHPWAIIIDGFVDGFVHQGLQVGSTPLIGCSTYIGHYIFLDVVQTAQLLIKDLPENAPPLVLVRKRNVNLKVEPARPQDGLVDKIEPVCGSHDHYALVGSESVQLVEELIDGGRSFVAVSQVVGSASQSIDFVDEYDATLLVRPGNFEKLSHSFGAHTDV